MQYHQEKFNSGKKLNSTADFNLEIAQDSIIYRGTFFMEFKNGDDNLFTNESFYQYDPYYYNENNIVTYFFNLAFLEISEITELIKFIISFLKIV